MTALTMTAAHHGWCPCGKYIRAGVSEIAAVDVPLPPEPDVCWYSAERRRWYVDGAEGHIRARRWLHARCATKLNGLPFDELELLAADRRHALAGMKRSAERAHGHQHGRQRRARSKSTRAAA